MNTTLEKLKERIKDKKYKLTTQRQTILQAFIDADEEFAHFHHHLICVKCGKVSEFEDDMLETLESIIAKKLNFRTIDHQLKVYGYCSDCQNHMTEAELDKLERMAHHHA